MLPPFNDNFESWLEELRKREGFIVESWGADSAAQRSDKNNKPHGLWTWYYEKNGQKECELEFDNGYPTYFRSWYKDGSKKKNAATKIFFPKSLFRLGSKMG